MAADIAGRGGFLLCGYGEREPSYPGAMHFTPIPPTLHMAAWYVLKTESHHYTDSLAQKPQLAPCCLWTKAFSRL